MYRTDMNYLVSAHRWFGPQPMTSLAARASAGAGSSLTNPESLYPENKNRHRKNRGLYDRTSLEYSAFPIPRRIPA